MNIIINKDNTRLEIDDSLYEGLVKEKDSFEKWLDGFDDSYHLVCAEVEDCYYIDNTFQMNCELDDSISEIVWNNFDDDFIPSFDFSVIGNEFLNEFSTLSLVLIMLNFPEIIAKINEVRNKLGGLDLTTPIDSDSIMRFEVDFPFEGDSEYSNMVKEKVIECHNKMVDELYDIEIPPFLNEK